MTEANHDLMITEEESLVLEAIAQSIVPYSQRAQALLALDAGSTADQAANVSGLRVTQVRYWISRFRKDRILAFPDELLLDIESLIKEKAKEDKKAAKKAKKSEKAKGKKKPAKAADSGKNGKKKGKAAKKKADKPKAGKKDKKKKAAAEKKKKSAKKK